MKMQKYKYLLILVVSLMLVGCVSSSVSKPNSVSNANLVGTYWKLKELSSQNIQTKNSAKEAHIIFSKEGAKGSTSCNNFSTTYALDANELSISKSIMMTRMFCRGSVEGDFILALKKMRRYEVDGERLEIFDEDGVSLAKFESVYLY
jgi:heat shock protein HslJ